MISESSRRLGAALLFGLCVASAVVAAAPQPDVTPADFKSPPPLIDPDAGAEIMLAETTIDESYPTDMAWAYLFRVRIVDDRGVGIFRKIEIPYGDSTSISNIEARTYKPDGTVLTLDKKEIFTRDIVKTRTARRSVKSFAPPGLEPGVILEYRYVERRDRVTPLYALHFQRDVPVRVARYKLKPYPAVGYDLRSVSFNLPPFSLKPDAQGFFTLEATNLKGWKNEPFQLPPIQQQASAVLYYNPAESDVMSAEAYWAKVGGALFARTESVAKPTKAVRAVVDGILAPNDSPDSKLRKIHDYVRSKLKNRDLDVSGYTREQRQKLPKNDNAEQTLKNGQGSADDLVIAFTALARAAGFDARLALASDRTFIVYDGRMREPFIFRKLIAAVKTGEAWTFCDPGGIYFPVGMIDWKYSGAAVLVADKGRALIAHVPMTPSPVSGRTRQANFTVDEQGTLEGRVKITLNGYLDAAAKNRYDALSVDEREKSLKEEIQKQFPLAELSEITIEHAADPLEPLTMAFQLRLPGFAERTGSRLFLQPAVLHKGTPPIFEARERRSPVIFNYLYSEKDEIEIVVPSTFKLEAGNAPAGVEMGKLGRYKVNIGYSAKNARISYAREFELDAVGIPARFYPTLKQVFDEVNSQDNHTLTFRDESSAAPAGGQPVTTAATEEKKG